MRCVIMTKECSWLPPHKAAAPPKEQTNYCYLSSLNAHPYVPKT